MLTIVSVPDQEVFVEGSGSDVHAVNSISVDSGSLVIIRAGICEGLRRDPDVSGATYVSGLENRVITIRFLKALFQFGSSAVGLFYKCSFGILIVDDSG